MRNWKSVPSAPGLRRSRRVLIIQAGAAPAALRGRHGDFPEWFRRGLGFPESDVVVARVDAGDVLPPPNTVAAAVITGSDAMVSERLPWSERSADWLRNAAQAGLPMLGVCYGHQLLAHAFGGHVDYNPRGLEIGTVEIQRLAVAADDALFAALPPRFRAHSTHLQSVLTPPATAVVLARSALDDCQALRYAPNLWSVQFHPEFGVAHMRGYLREEDNNTVGAELAAASVGASPQGRALLRRFARIVADAEC